MSTFWILAIGWSITAVMLYPMLSRLYDVGYEDGAKQGKVDGWSVGWQDGYRAGKEYVWLAQKTVEGMNGWIPCSEKLPNTLGCYLVWRPHFFGGEIGMPAICYFDGQNTWHDSYGVDFTRVLDAKDVTAWMPLPEDYEETTKCD